VSLKDLQLASKPASAEHPCIVIISGKMAGRLFKLSPGATVIGRGTDTTIRVEDEGISRRHVQVTLTSEGKVFAEDMGSTNGTIVNNEKTSGRTELKNGDRIELGSTTILKFSYTDTVEEEYQRNLYDSATRDPMTGAYNKKFFVDRLTTEFAYSSRHTVDLSMCMLDIDFFKKVNDTHGHPAGDAILKHFAALVVGQIRGEDIFCRYGGEEFTLILRQTTSREAFGLADRVRKTLEAKVCTFDGKAIPVTCSIGVATHRGNRYTSAEQLLKAADEALYKSKQGGRNRVTLAPEETPPAAPASSNGW
jgi:two-component system cell cycle response regulator